MLVTNVTRKRVVVGLDPFKKYLLTKTDRLSGATHVCCIEKKPVAALKANDIEPPHYNQCEVLASKIHSNFNETFSDDLIRRITEVSVSKKPITWRWQTTAKDDSILGFFLFLLLSLSRFYSLFPALSLSPFSSLREESNCLITLISPEMPAFF